MVSFRIYLESNNELQALIQNLKAMYPGLYLFADENSYRIFIHEIRLPKDLRGQGTGTKAMQAIQQYAKQVNLPIVLSPSPEPRKKAALLKFYRELGFYPNKGRKKDYTLSMPFAPTWIWRPR